MNKNSENNGVFLTDEENNVIGALAILGLVSIVGGGIYLGYQVGTRIADGVWSIANKIKIARSKKKEVKLDGNFYPKEEIDGAVQRAGDAWVQAAFKDILKDINLPKEAE